MSDPCQPLQCVPCSACPMTPASVAVVSHVILTGLRSGGKKGYQIPRGFLFNYVT